MVTRSRELRGLSQARGSLELGADHGLQRAGSGRGRQRGGSEPAACERGPGIGVCGMGRVSPLRAS